MSMTGRYLLLTVPQLDDLIDETVDILEFVYPEDFGNLADALDLDKTWHVIHYLLNGEVWDGEEPLFDAVLGGVELPGTDGGYGPFRYLLPEDVQLTAAALADIPVAALWERFEPGEAEGEEIYGWTTSAVGPEALSTHRAWVSERYDALRTYFAGAARAGKAMLLHLS